jgi:ubiquinone/menaquinone biosynthesis C-methylase UbiE
MSEWEDAYLRYMTPEEEVRSFTERLTLAGVDKCDRNSRVVELFCGRGSGLNTLAKLGFTAIVGIDLSPTLLNQYSGNATRIAADCRQLPLANDSQDIVFSQDGLHHMSRFPEDVEQVLREIHRTLKKDGRAVILEPWLTPRLWLLRMLCRIQAFRKLSPRIAAFATMADLEYPTYDFWLSHPAEIIGLLAQYFRVERQLVRPGQLVFVGRK